MRKKITLENQRFTRIMKNIAQKTLAQFKKYS